jgi:TonB family protein
MTSRLNGWSPFIVMFLLAALPQATTPQSKTGEQPEVQRIVGLSYPRIANLGGIEGTVKLIAKVSPAGTVDSVRVISGNGLLADSARQALLEWHFRCPNVSKPCEASVSFIFKLGEICDRQSCPSELQIDLPSEVTVQAKRIRGFKD